MHDVGLYGLEDLGKYRCHLRVFDFELAVLPLQLDGDDGGVVDFISYQAVRQVLSLRPGGENKNLGVVTGR